MKSPERVFCRNYQSIDSAEADKSTFFNQSSHILAIRETGSVSIKSYYTIKTHICITKHELNSYLSLSQAAIYHGPRVDPVVFLDI